DTAWGGGLGDNGHFLFIGPIDQTSAFWSVSYLSETPCEPKHVGTMSEAKIEQVLLGAEQRLRPFGEPIPTLFKETLHSSIAVKQRQRHGAHHESWFSDFYR
ncbi:unnamed protein product, partial [Rotaria sp. Silwood1]